MELILKKSQAVCPECSGLVVPLILSKVYRCIDCRTVYRISGNGYAEDAMEVEIKNNN